MHFFRKSLKFYVPEQKLLIFRGTIIIYFDIYSIIRSYHYFIKKLQVEVWRGYHAFVKYNIISRQRIIPLKTILCTWVMKKIVNVYSYIFYFSIYILKNTIFLCKASIAHQQQILFLYLLATYIVFAKYAKTLNLTSDAICLTLFQSQVRSGQVCNIRWILFTYIQTKVYVSE